MPLDSNTTRDIDEFDVAEAARLLGGNFSAALVHHDLSSFRGRCKIFKTEYLRGIVKDEKQPQETRVCALRELHARNEWW